jgi:hypothetical protein
MIFSSLFLPSQYANEAAVGSFIILSTFSHAISHADLVAFLWLSLKYAGTVITADVTASPRYFSASSLIFFKINHEICSGL